MTRRSLLRAGAAAAGAAALTGMAGPGPARAAQTKNLVVVGENGNLNIVTPGGAMLMYYHGGWQSGGTSWLGPYHRGDGFNGFGRLAAAGVAYSYDNLYVGVNGSGVYGYYWDNAANRYLNGGAGYPLVTPQRRGWDDLRQLFSGGWTAYGTEPGCVFYTIDYWGNLYWHKYAGRPGQGGYWTLNSGRLIGVGWEGFSYVTADPNGRIWAVEPGGVMRWYGYGSPYDGANNAWEGASGTVVGSGWRGGTYGYQTVQAAGWDPNVQTSPGGLYMVDRDGNLRWNRHLGAQNGQPNWLYPANGGKIIGNGWM